MQRYDIAAELAATRAERGLTLSEISRQTKIQIEHLQKLEGGCYDFLPHFYVRQIVRSYAQALDLPADTIESYLQALDAQALANSSDTQLPDASKEENPLLSDTQLERLAMIFSPIRLAIVGALLLAAAIGVTIFHFGLAPHEAEVIHRTGSSVSYSSAPAPTAQPAPSKPHTTPKPTTPAPTIDAVSAVPPSTDTKRSASLSVPATDDKRKLTLVVRAKSDCWVGVVADEHKIQEAYLRANESSRFEADSLVKLTIGKAEVAEVWLNGKSIELPKRAGVVSNLRFSLKDVSDLTQ
jgi:cytoskeletal protein RodZ